MTKYRINWIDTSKCLGIYLVVLGHLNQPYSHFVIDTIYAFHMPLFFIISGYLYKSLPIGKGVKKDFLSLLMPFYLMNIIGITIALGKSLLDGSVLNMDRILLLLKLIFLGQVRNDAYYATLDFMIPIWFLLALFAVKAFNYLIDLSKNKIVLFASIPISMATVYIMKLYGKEVSTFFFDSALLALPFFILGRSLKNHDILNKIFSIRLPFKALFIILLSATTVIIARYNSPNLLVICYWGKSMLLYYLSGITGSLALFLFANTLGNFSNKFTNTISSGTMLILGFHILVIEGMYSLIKILHIEASTYIFFFAAALIVTFFYPLIIFCSRWFPIILGNKLPFKNWNK